MHKSIFHIAQMDCPSEEHLIRMKLEDFDCVVRLDFDIGQRKLTIYHDCAISDKLESSLNSLNLGATLIESETIANLNVADVQNDQSVKDRSLLVKVLFINAVFFVVELVWGFISDSMGLISDGLDMLADALVYSLALFAIGRSTFFKKKVSKWAGLFQLFLAILGLGEVLRRSFYHDSLPDFHSMIWVSALALMGNLASLILLRKSQNSESHIKASLIFTSNDVLANIGVILAGVLVLFFQSMIPDLVIGFVVFGMVLRGALQILKL